MQTEFKYGIYTATLNREGGEWDIKTLRSVKTSGSISLNGESICFAKY